ncbi:hypothetical protein RFI_10901 [Reticulomyxa filosa]|uniref:Endonuclease/exonuclease/phosphatase domain-containing protein n=1 Tax=Reticulomyxa filosa TaxID=46433 RepID=X6NJZ3_RETFI|nr:hypothetical protein RFI_10901 [Reticulomyxa filosa]|eukprot:ETO26233.1 hypothetical protein RFI_10901 [Reticulomyxa filosa]
MPTAAPKRLLVDPKTINLRSYQTYCQLQYIQTDPSTQLFHPIFSPVSSGFIVYITWFFFFLLKKKKKHSIKTCRQKEMRDEKEEMFADAILPASQRQQTGNRNAGDNKAFAHRKDEEDIPRSMSLEEALQLPPDHHLQVDIGRGILKKTFLPIEAVLDMKKINLYQPTFKRKDWSIDYVLVNFPVNHVKNYVLGKRGGLSDHFFIITEFNPTE